MFFDGRKLFALDKKTAQNCKIYSMLKGVKKREKISFHTPGHKIIGWDITELDFSDNLSCPNGCIKQAQEEVATLLGADKSFLLTDGSTSGILAMLYAAKQFGVNKLAVPYHSHKSVFNGCKLLQIQPIVFGKKTSKNIPLPPTMVELNEVIGQADALFLTSPTYYGDVMELSKVRELCDTHNKLLLIDGAHGGHLRFDKQKHAGGFADLWVDGVHKSLPALTQGSVVSSKKKELSKYLQEGVDIFRTTSPSYPILASAEFAVKFPRNEKLENAVETFKKENPTRLYQNADYTKLCVLAGTDAVALQKRLQQKGIYAEFCDGNVLMFYISPATAMRSFTKLKKALCKEFQMLSPYEMKEENSAQQNHAPSLLQITHAEWVDIEKAVGYVCAKTFGQFPPCVPCVFEGEIVTAEAVEKMKSADNVFGMENGKVYVYQIQE